MNEPDNKRGRRVLLMLVAIFLAPVLVAIVLNSRWTDWQPAPTRNYGKLVQPVLAIGPPPSEVPDAELAALPLWQLLNVVDSDCDTACLERLETLTRVKRTLGRDQDSLQIVLVTQSPAEAARPLAAVWVDSGTRVAGLLAQRDLPPAGIFIVDPLGNLMMHYPEPVDTTGLSKDLDRLISNSKFQ